MSFAPLCPFPTGGSIQLLLEVHLETIESLFCWCIIFCFQCFAVLEQVGMGWEGTGLWCRTFGVGLAAALLPPNAGNLLWTGTTTILEVLAKDWWNNTRGSCLLENDLHPRGCVIGLCCRFPQEQGDFGAMFGVPAAPLAQGSAQTSLFPDSPRVPGASLPLWALGRSRSCGFPGSLEQPQHR